MSFTDKTRRKVIALGTKSYAAGATMTWDIPKTGLLSAIMLDVQITTGAGVPGAPHAMGASAAINRVRLIANSGIDLINISGPGYHFLMRNFIEDFRDAVPSASAAATAVAAATSYDYSMFLPVAINNRDPLGLFMLQNEATLLQLTLECLDPVSLGGAGVSYATYNVTPYVVIFSVPADPKDWPPLNVIHQVIEETRAVSAAGAFEYKWPRGNTYCQVLHGMGIDAVPTDNFSAVNLTVNQSDRLWDMSPNSLDIEYGVSHGVARPAGVVAIDFLGSSGLGTFGSARDMLYSALVTEIATNFTAAAAGTLYTIRRQLVSLKG
jgi:hypothetical protein